MEQDATFNDQTLVQLSENNWSQISELAGKGIQSVRVLGLPDLVNHTLDKAIHVLLSMRENIPDHDQELTRLDNAIIPLIKIQRSMTSVGGPYDMIQTTTLQRDQQMLMDINQDNLYNNLPDWFGVPYLGDADACDVTWPVSGILYGTANRPMVCLPVQLRNCQPKNVFFLVDTGAPITELSPDAFRHLGSCESIPSGAYAKVAGFPRTKVHLTKAYAAGGNHEDIPVLGADFLSKNRCTLTIDYFQETVTIHLR